MLKIINCCYVLLRKGKTKHCTQPLLSSSLPQVVLCSLAACLCHPFPAFFTCLLTPTYPVFLSLLFPLANSQLSLPLSALLVIAELKSKLKNTYWMKDLWPKFSATKTISLGEA